MVSPSMKSGTGETTGVYTVFETIEINLTSNTLDDVEAIKVDWDVESFDG